MPIIQGDNGITIDFVCFKSGIVDLTGATVSIKLNRNEEIIVKPADVLDAVNGKCTFTLYNSDLTIVDSYSYIWTATFDDGRIWSGGPYNFFVYENYIVLPSNEDVFHEAIVGSAIVGQATVA